MAVLILGANSDIGKACARQWAVQGMTLHLCARNTEGLATHKEALEQVGATVHLHAFDATEYEGTRQLFGSLDPFPKTTLVAFGYLGDEDKARNDADEREQILAVNLNAAVHAVGEVASIYEKAGDGVIAGISSVAGDRGKGRTLVYGAAKAGLTNYLDGLRNALHGTGAHVVTIKPGFVRTRMTAGMDTPGPLTADPDKVAKDILKAIRKRKNSLYTKGIWRMVMFVIRNIPEFIFKKREW